MFIGGLIRRSAEQSREGLPVLGDVPGIGRLFSNKSMSSNNTELVVLIAPYIIEHEEMALDLGSGERLREIGDDLEVAPTNIESVLSEEKYLEDIVSGQ